jgi:VanZ family protein
MVVAMEISDLKLRNLWLAIGYLLVIFVLYQSLSSHPIAMSGLFDYEDKLYHVLAYFTLMTWFAQIYHQRTQRIIIALLFVFMGLMVEYLQSLNPNRYAEFGDMVANVTGVVLGFALTVSAAKNILLRVEKQFFSAS